MSPAPARVDELKKRYEENPRRFFAPLANEYRKAGELEAAIDLCRMHLEEQPGHLSGHIVYGQALYEAARPAEAKKAFDAALTLDPENLIALRHLGDIAKADGDAAAATHWYQRVLDADPRNDEVIALIAVLQEAPTPPTVVVVEEPPPPPPPQYAVEAAPAVELSVVDASAPTPVIAAAVVPPPQPAAPPSLPVSSRGSIGLMDLDLNLGEPEHPAGDLLRDVAGPATTPPAVDVPAPIFEEGFPLADSTLPVSLGEVPELLGAEDTNLGLAGPESATVEGLDTSFDVEGPLQPESTFAAVPSTPEFGDGLDVTIAADAEAESPAAETRDARPALDEATAEDRESTTSAVAPAAEPAPPTAGDFDMLFGNAPIADVTVGGDGAPADTSDAAFVAEQFVGGEPVGASPDAATDIGATPPPFVTETMAELYLQQGFREEALDVYRQLLAQSPGDTGLAERVRHLERGARSSLPIDRVSDEIEAASEAEERRRSGSIAAVPVASAPEETIPMLPDAVPAFLVTGPAPTPATPVTPAAPRGPTAREVFARVAMRRAVAGGGFAPPPIIEPVTEPAPLPPFDAGWSPRPAEITAPLATDPVGPGMAPTALPGGSIDQLFGFSGVTTNDERAAAAVAAAFGDEPAAPEAPIKGQAAYTVTDELSLQSVFHGEGGAAPAAPAVQRQSTKLRFDQFFAGTDDAASASPATSSTPVSSAPGKSAEDIAQFNDWLKGLKGS